MSTSSNNILPNGIAAPSIRLYTCPIAKAHQKLLPDSVDWIVTDPPYPKDYLAVYVDLARFANRVLKPGGSLLCMCGQSYLLTVGTMLSSKLQYHWELAYLTPGGKSPQLFQKRVNSFWKPVLWFTKGDYSGKWIGDVSKSQVNDNDKRHHHWGQSESGIHDLIRRFAKPGDVVCDPFVGGGTVAVVAVRMGISFIGMDIDKETVSRTRQRLAELEDAP